MPRADEPQHGQEPQENPHKDEHARQQELLRKEAADAALERKLRKGEDAGNG